MRSSDPELQEISVASTSGRKPSTFHAWVFALLAVFVSGAIALTFVIDLEHPKSVRLLLVIFLIGIYFESRNRNAPPSRIERSLASFWRIVRIFVGLVGAAFFGYGAFVAITTKGTDGLLAAGVALAMCFGCLWIAFVGNAYGGHRSDITLHRENKKRYGWRF